MIRVSVCVVTARPGGIDALLCGLQRQEFDARDIEVVLVDGLYHRRCDEVADRFARARLSLVHTPPRVPVCQADEIPAYRNTAIAKAHGELLLWVVDYSVLPPRCLSEHWGVWEYWGKRKAGMGAHQYLFPPPVAYPLPDYAPIRRFTPHEVPGVTYQYLEEDSRAFTADLLNGTFDPYGYSVFQNPLETPEQLDQLREDPYFFQVDPKRHGVVGGDLTGTFFHAKNETVARDRAVAANGFDEGYTGHLYDDTDFGYRLQHGGAEWVLLDPVATVQIVNPRHLFPPLLRRSPAEAHRQKHDAVKDDPASLVAENPYRLAEYAGCQWWYD